MKNNLKVTFKKTTAITTRLNMLKNVIINRKNTDRFITNKITYFKQGNDSH